MLTFTLFDVGHGFCAYAATPAGAGILFDCGYDSNAPFYPSGYFARAQISHISTLVLSHFDQDHVCDLPSLRRGINFQCIMRNSSIPGAYIRSEKEIGGVITAAMASALDMHEGWTGTLAAPINYGGADVRFFCNSYPTFTDMNNLSVVTFLRYGGCRVVVPGDLERAGWLELLKRQDFCQYLSATNVFIASHHGRAEGYCEEVFSYCRPEVVLISDKSLVHESQEQNYARHAAGISWPDGTRRYVLTTRCDGHIQILAEAGPIAHVFRNVDLGKAPQPPVRRYL